MMQVSDSNSCGAKHTFVFIYFFVSFCIRFRGVLKNVFIQQGRIKLIKNKTFIMLQKHFK